MIPTGLARCFCNIVFIHFSESSLRTARLYCIILIITFFRLLLRQSVAVCVYTTHWMTIIIWMDQELCCIL